jgi:hypothetical protein
MLKTNSINDGSEKLKHQSDKKITALSFNKQTSCYFIDRINEHTLVLNELSTCDTPNITTESRGVTVLASQLNMLP